MNTQSLDIHPKFSYQINFILNVKYGAKLLDSSFEPQMKHLSSMMKLF